MTEIALPPLEVFLSDDWIGGARAGRLLDKSMSAVISPSASSLMDFASVALEGQAGSIAALQTVYELGSQAISVFKGGSAWGIAGFSAAAIQLFVGALLRATQNAAQEAKDSALQAQWDIASYLVLRRQAQASTLPGGANYNNAQPGWKKDWKAPAVPAIPPEVQSYQYEAPETGTYDRYTRLVLFTKGSPKGLDMPDKCFALTDAKTAEACDMPGEAQVGLSLLTWPILVESDSLPWGGGHLSPWVALLTAPTALHVQVKQADVDALRMRIRSVMREMWRIVPGPPLRADAATVWPDGTYTGPTTRDQTRFQKARKDVIDQAYEKQLALFKKSGEKDLGEWFKVHPWEPPGVGSMPLVPRVDAGPFGLEMGDGNLRRGATRHTAYISATWENFDAVSGAIRTLERWAKCRQACLRHFAKLPADVRTLAKKNPDFADEKIAIWGGPNGRPAPPPTGPKKEKSGLLSKLGFKS